jgi:hypothetical protein
VSFSYPFEYGGNVAGGTHELVRVETKTGACRGAGFATTKGGYDNYIR